MTQEGDIELPSSGVVTFSCRSEATATMDAVDIHMNALQVSTIS